MKATRALRSWPSAAALLFGGLALASCEEAVGPATQVMLRIQSEDRALIAAMTRLQVRFALEEDEPWGWQSYPTREFAKGVLRWPVDIPIVPSDQEDEYKRFEVVVEALDGSRILAQQRAVTGFTAGGLRLLEVWLYTCPGAEALSCAAPGCQGESCGVCQLDGKCGSSVIAPERLPAFDVDADPVSRPPFGATAGPMLSAGDNGAGTSGLQAGTGANAGLANPGGAPSAMAGMPGGFGAMAGTTVLGGVDAGMGSGGMTGAISGAADAGSTVDAGGYDPGVRDASTGTLGGTSGATTGGTTGAAGGGVDAGLRDAGGPRDAALESSVPREASVPEGGTIGGGVGGGSSEAGTVGGSFGGFAGGAGSTSAFASDESEFGPGSYSGW